MAQDQDAAGAVPFRQLEHLERKPQLGRGGDPRRVHVAGLGDILDQERQLIVD